MALQEYITVADINNKIFNLFQEVTRQKYIDMANDYLEDLAKTNNITLTNIVIPIHTVLKRHIVNFALSVFAEDMIDFGSDGSETVGKDKYENLFKRTRYLLQESKLEIVPVMFTGETETQENRAIQSVRLYRG